MSQPERTIPCPLSRLLPRQKHSPTPRQEDYYMKLAIAVFALCGTLASGQARSQLAENYGNLPLSFEVNAGQADRDVKFLARSGGDVFYLMPDGSALTFRPGTQPAQ